MASPPYSSYSEPASLRRRATSFVLAVAANLLLLFMLLTLAPAPGRQTPPESRPTVVDLLPEPETPKVASTRVAEKKAASSRAAPRAPKPPAPRAAVTAPATAPPLNMILLNRDEYAAADISKMQAPDRAAGGGSANGTGSNASGDTANGSGEGPGGERLYNADWYREPTDAELAPYLPSRSPRAGWGEVACRTVPNFRVEDCAELGQSPPGSGLARAVRQAAWQFRVRPPRIGGQGMVGAWVRVRIDYSQRATPQ
ncbi:hypothetical protein [Sphingomonas solaris]|uniref:Energy transducer TonB n=1 Tax=Alterirhizorhabdus solaris TaxID=2529389 RepID=A0A558QS78_9SPHN|nr:hypothetical protein [Sphingomonas solaris]TVV69964.1 hypothetical protein FOY91_20265 [Sphingomonas solaris]